MQQFRLMCYFLAITILVLNIIAFWHVLPILYLVNIAGAIVILVLCITLDEAAKRIIQHESHR
jgi:hypothetical protein